MYLAIVVGFLLRCHEAPSTDQSQLHPQDYNIIFKIQSKHWKPIMISRAAGDNVKYGLNFIIWTCLWHAVTLISLSHRTLPTASSAHYLPGSNEVGWVGWVYPPSGDHNETTGGLDTVYLLHTLLNPQFPPLILASSRITSKTNLPGLSFCLTGFELQNPATGTLAITSRVAHKNCLLHLSVQTHTAHHLPHPSPYKAETPHPCSKGKANFSLSLPQNGNFSEK